MLLTLAVEQRHRGMEPIILSIGNLSSGSKPLEAEARARELRCIPLRMRDGLNLSGAKRILDIARREEAAVVHSHGYKSNILLALLPAGLRDRPIVTTLHGWTAKRAFSKLGLYRLIDQCLLRRLDAVVVVNEQLLGSAVLRSVPEMRVHVVPNGIALQNPTDESELDAALVAEIRELKRTCTAVVGAVGRLSPEKNFLALIDAVSRVLRGGHAVGLVILGDGPEATLLRQSAHKHQLTRNVVFGGYVKDARRYLELFDLLAIPSLTEGLPVTLLEAMAANLPVIATNVGDMPRTLGGLGIIVRPGDVSDLAQAIETAVADLPASRAAANAGRARVAAEYSAAAMAERYEAVYRSAARRYS